MSRDHLDTHWAVFMGAGSTTKRASPDEPCSCARSGSALLLQGRIKVGDRKEEVW